MAPMTHTRSRALLIDTEFFALADLVEAIHAHFNDEPSHLDLEDVLDGVDEQLSLLVAERLVDAATIGQCIELGWIHGWELDAATAVLESLNAHEVLARLVGRGVPLPISVGTALELAADPLVDLGDLEYLEESGYLTILRDTDDRIAFHLALASRGGEHREAARQWCDEHDVDLSAWDSPRYELTGAL